MTGRNDKNIEKNDKYLAIKRGFESKEVWVEIEFLLTIKPVHSVPHNSKF